MPFTIPNEASVPTFPTLADVDSVDFDILASAHLLNGVVSGCAVTAQGTPDMTLAVSSGVVMIGGQAVNVASGNVTVTTAHSTLARYDMVVVNSAGVKSVVAGTAASVPTFPTVPASSVALAIVLVPAAATAITDALLVDKRMLLPRNSQVFDVREYGAIPDTVFKDGVANGTTTFTSATANFTANDVGKHIWIKRATSDNVRNFHTTISSVTNSTTVVLSVAVPVTRSGLRFGLGVANHVAFQAAIDAAFNVGGGTIYAAGSNNTSCRSTKCVRR